MYVEKGETLDLYLRKSNIACIPFPPFYAFEEKGRSFCYYFFVLPGRLRVVRRDLPEGVTGLYVRRSNLNSFNYFLCGNRSSPG